MQKNQTNLQTDGGKELNSTDRPVEPWIQKKKESHFVLEILNCSRNTKFSYRGFSALATWPNKCNYQNYIFLFEVNYIFLKNCVKATNDKLINFSILRQ